MIYRKLMIVGCRVIVGAPRERGMFWGRGVRYNVCDRLQAFPLLTSPPPLAPYFFHLLAVSFRSRCFSLLLVSVSFLSERAVRALDPFTLGNLIG